MKMILLLTFCLFLGVCNFSSTADGKTQDYGEKVSFADGGEIKFPDFLIKSIGKREVGYPNADSPRKITFYDFEITKGETKQKVSWSSGTGDIAPTFFEIGGAGYVLELGQSDIIKGSLGEGNLVIWKKAEYEKRISEKTKS